MPQTGAYLDAVYKRILHLSKISAMCLITNYHSVLYNIFDMLIKVYIRERLKIFNDMLSHTLIKRFYFHDDST